MPAPVRSSVLPSLSPRSCRDIADERVWDGVVVDDSDGAKKSTSAAIAPLVVFALAGIMRGRGRGSVYGTRRRGIARTRKTPRPSSIAILQSRNLDSGAERVAALVMS